MENNRLSQNSDKIDSINNEETNGNNKKSRKSEQTRIFGSLQDEIAEEVDTSHSSKTFNSIAIRNGSNSETLRNSSVNNEETNGNNKKSRKSEQTRIFGSLQDEIAEEVDTSHSSKTFNSIAIRNGSNSETLRNSSVNNEETNGNNKKSRKSEQTRIFGSLQDEIAEEVDTSHSSKTFNSIAIRNGSNSETLRNSSVNNKSIAWSPDTNNTTNKEDVTINAEPYNNGNTVGDENSKDSVSVISPQTIKKTITLSEKSKDNNRTQSAPTTKTKESVVEEATSGVTKCTIECTKGIKGANVKNGDGKGKCILCEIEKIIKTKERVSRSGSTSKNVSCGADCGRSSKGKKKGDYVKKLKCMKSLDCKKTAPECKSKKRPKRILSIRNISETCLPPEKETSKKVICSTCPNSDEEENSTKRGGGGEAEGSEKGNLNDTQSTGKGKKGNKRCQKMRNFCRKLCACCRKKSKDDEEEDKDDEGNGNGSQRKGKRRRKKKKKPQKRFPEGKKPPCAGKSNNMTRFYGRRPACHAGFGMCHPCHPPWTPARLPFFACSTPRRKKRVHSS